MTDLPPPTPRRLTRSSSDRWLAGVCGGVAAYTGVDPTVVRLAVVILTCLGGSGLAAYVIAWLVIPDEHQPVSHAESLLGRFRSGS